jgi:pyochelin biosynthetic protein PchC
VALTGDRDPKVSVGEAGGWSGLSTGPFELQVFAGGHFYLSDQVGEVSSVLLDTLRAAEPIVG